MTVSLQFHAWLLPPAFALLVVARELSFLRPRWRERAAPAFAVFAALVGAWAVAGLAEELVVSPGARLRLLRLELALALGAAAALPTYALLEVRGRRWVRSLSRRSIAFLALGGLTVLSLWLGLAVEAGEGLFLADHAFAVVGEVRHLTWRPGLAARASFLVMALASGGSVTLLAVGRRSDPEGAGVAGAPWERAGRVALLALVGAVLVAPVVPGLGTRTAKHLLDLALLGHALAVAVLSGVFLRPRLRGLGPVARKLVVKELRDPILVFDGRGRIVDLNRSAERTLGLQAFGEVPVALGTLWAGGRGEAREITGVHLPVAGPDGHREERVFDITVTPLDAGGGAQRSVLLLRDVTRRERMDRELREASRALQEANRELERLANTDPLTGLANRRRFMEALDAEVGRSERYGHPTSLLLMDLDHFKQVNDTHGHAAGDDVLREAAGVLRAACREVDLAARIGGEELAILLPETDAEGASVVAERVRREVGALRFTSPAGVPFGVTVSIGVADTEQAGASWSDLMHEADRALYRAKDEGRNRVVVSA